MNPDRFLPRFAPYEPYRVVSVCSSAELTAYIGRIVAGVSSRRKLYKAEVYYHHFLASYANQRGLSSDASDLMALESRFEWIDPETPGEAGASGISDALASVKVIKVGWRILPNPEGLSADQLIHALREHLEATGGDHLQFIESRIYAALALKPKQIAIGDTRFCGYYAMCLDADVVLFECPVHGHAAYVAKGDWRDLSRLEKSWLRRYAQRVVHVGSKNSWSGHIKRAVNRAKYGPFTRLPAEL